MDSMQVLTYSKKTNYIFILLLLGLLILRFPFSILLDFHKILIPKTLGLNIFNNYTYLLTAMLILLKRDSLSDYHIDFGAVTIFLIAPIAKSFSEYSINYLSIQSIQSNSSLTKAFLKSRIFIAPISIIQAVSNSSFQIIVSICLLISLLFCRPKLRKKNIKQTLLWLMIAIVVGICSGVLSKRIVGLNFQSKSIIPTSIPITICQFFIELANAAVIEEPLFRGFLWGFLKNIHWKDCWILLLQAVLFMIGHIHYLGINNYALVNTLIGGLILGLMAWHSRSISTSMIVHTLTNSLGSL
ncbi:MAG: CPBP family intramembrane metalloprotease [Methanobacterium paludis]|nr:CPBP family intramembrane metalloprotease [Methanobacterium paludis]